jgi:hypothetical protein
MNASREAATTAPTTSPRYSNGTLVVLQAAVVNTGARRLVAFALPTNRPGGAHFIIIPDQRVSRANARRVWPNSGSSKEIDCEWTVRRP